MRRTIRHYAMVALSVLGSATLLFSCKKSPEPTVYDYETLMTESSENRTITMMENGKRSYIFTTPLIEGYSVAKNPYQEFRRGVKITTFTNDSIPLVDVILTANYAIYYENQKLWEAKGDVVVHKHNRKGSDTTVTDLTEVYTQQLFWNATTQRIYSNVDTKVLQPDGWHFGVGFDADEELTNIHFRKYSSEMEFEMSQQERRVHPDSVQQDSSRVDERVQKPRAGSGNKRADEDKNRRLQERAEREKQRRAQQAPSSLPSAPVQRVTDGKNLPKINRPGGGGDFKREIQGKQSVQSREMLATPKQSKTPVKK